MQITPTIACARHSFENSLELTTSGLYAWLLIRRLIPMKDKRFRQFDLEDRNQRHYLKEQSELNLKALDPLEMLCYLWRERILAHFGFYIYLHCLLDRLGELWWDMNVRWKAVDNWVLWFEEFHLWEFDQVGLR